MFTSLNKRMLDDRTTPLPDQCICLEGGSLFGDLSCTLV
jgi:hypothetical protein